MNDESRPQDGPRANPTRKIAPSIGRLTDLQTATVGVIRALEGWREVFHPRVYAYLLIQLSLWIDRELRRPDLARWVDREAA